MANLVLNFGPVSVTVVLIVCAAFLSWEGDPDWVTFFNLGVYSAIWNALWSAAHQVVRRALNAEEGYYNRVHPGSVLGFYFLAFSGSVLLTAVFASFIFRRI